jgi:hypothetical protein
MVAGLPDRVEPAALGLFLLRCALIVARETNWPPRYWRGPLPALDAPMPRVALSDRGLSWGVVHDFHAGVCLLRQAANLEAR